MSNKDLESHINSLEDKRLRVEKFKSELNIKAKEDNTFEKLIQEAGRNQKYMIYNFAKNELEFVDKDKADKIDITISPNHLYHGLNNCNICLNHFANNLKITSMTLKRNLK